MRKTKSMLLCLLLSLFSFSFAYIAATIVNPANAKIYSPYEQDEGLALSVSYSDGSLIMNTTGGPSADDDGAYMYQYWIKKKVETGDIDGEITKQYIWQIVRAYDNTAEYTLSGLDAYENEEDNPYVDEYKKYNVIVRVKDSSGTVIDELYGAYAAEEIGKPVIESVKVNGRAYDDYIVVDKTGLLNININANMAGLTYSVFNGSTELVNNINAGTEKSIEINNIDTNTVFVKAGQYVLTLKAEIAGNEATKQIKLYVVDDYVAEERPIISSLEPAKQVGSTATFNMYVTYADGSGIKSADIDNYIYSLVSGNVNLNSTDLADSDFISFVKSGEGENEVLDYVEFTVDYGEGKYGIYQTTATVARNSISGTDDKAIIYYSGYATRYTEIDQSADSSGYDSEIGTYTVGLPIEITPSGEITGATGDVKFAFYREDASGWVLIRSYKTLAEAEKFIWTPTKAGTYNIQLRIMDSNAGSYEAALTKTYVVGDSKLTGDLDIVFYDYVADDYTDTLITGKAYKVEAVYKEEIEGQKVRLDDVLYMFTLTSENLGTIYLNKFNSNWFYMFIPGRADNYTFTARVIKENSFGYKDIAYSTNIGAYVQISLPQAADAYPETLTQYSAVFSGEGIISVNKNGETADCVIDQYAKTVIYSGIGEYVVTFKTDSIIYVLPQTVTYIVDENTEEIFADFDKSSAGDYTVDISSLENTPESFKIGDTAVPFTVDGYNVTIAKSDITGIDVDDYNAEFISGNTKYVRKVCVITEKITTAARFRDIFLDANRQGSGPAPLDEDLGGYYVLGNNIEFSALSGGGSPDIYPNKYRGFKGIFDGRGYTVANFSISGGEWTNPGSIFGDLTAEGVIRNVGFTNLSIKGPLAGIAKTVYGKIDNVFVGICLWSTYWGINGATGSTAGAICRTLKPGATVSNCVAYLNGNNYPDQHSTHANWKNMASFINIYEGGTLINNYTATNIDMTWGDSRYSPAIFFNQSGRTITESELKVFYSGTFTYDWYFYGGDYSDGEYTGLSADIWDLTPGCLPVMKSALNLAKDDLYYVGGSAITAGASKEFAMSTYGLFSYYNLELEDSSKGTITRRPVAPDWKTSKFILTAASGLAPGEKIKVQMKYLDRIVSELEYTVA